MSGGVVVARQNRYMHAFRLAGAVSEESAKSLQEIGIIPIGIFRRMEKSGIFQRTEDGRYFMNEEKAEEFVQRRHRFALVVLGAVAVWLLLTYLSLGHI